MNINTCLRLVIASTAFIAIMVVRPGVFAHDVLLHQIMTRRAATYSDNFAQFCRDASGKEYWEIPALQYGSEKLRIVGVDVIGARTIGWIDKGSNDADSPLMVTVNHFCTPVPRGRPTRALTDPPMFTLPAVDSFAWASSQYSNPQSWPNARVRELEALTQASPSSRDSSLARMFYALGTIVHLNQDATSPPHTRNDNHAWPATGRSYFEYYGEKTYVVRAIKNHDDSAFPGSLISWNDWLAAGFTKLEDFWDRKLYQGDSATLDANEGGQSGRQQLGLTEYGNGNFLSRDALYSELYAPSDGHWFPFPSLYSSVNFEQVFTSIPAGMRPAPLTDQITVNRKYLDKVADGVRMDNHCALSFLAVNGRKKTYPYALSIHDNKVLQAYHENLIPKAIQYSTAILDYFFRGRIETTLDPDYGFDGFGYRIGIVNRSGQPLRGGSFNLFFDNDSGVRTQIGVPNFFTPYNSSSTLDDNGETEAYFNLPLSTVSRFIFVYQDGTIGTTEETQSDPADNAKAIAVRSFDPSLSSTVILANLPWKGFFRSQTYPGIFFRSAWEVPPNDIRYCCMTTTWGGSVGVTRLHPLTGDVIENTLDGEDWPLPWLAADLVRLFPSECWILDGDPVWDSDAHCTFSAYVCEDSENSYDGEITLSEPLSLSTAYQSAVDMLESITDTELVDLPPMTRISLRWAGSPSPVLERDEEPIYGAGPEGLAYVLKCTDAPGIMLMKTLTRPTPAQQHCLKTTISYEYPSGPPDVTVSAAPLSNTGPGYVIVRPPTINIAFPNSVYISGESIGSLSSTPSGPDCVPLP